MSEITTGFKFNWGISGIQGDQTGYKGIILEPGMICYTGRNCLPIALGGNEDSAGWVFGGPQDYIDMAAGGPGVLQNMPMREVYLAREAVNTTVTPGVIYNVYMEYDIVTLTTAEQAEMYQKGLCG